MNTPDLIGRLRNELLGLIASAAQGVIAFSRITATSPDGQEDGVAGWPADGGDPDSGQETVRRMEPWGLHGRPATGIQGLIARVMGGEAQGLLAGVWTGGHGRQTLDPGESQLYCIAENAEVYLDKNGNVFLAASPTKKIVAAADAVFLGAESGAKLVVLDGDGITASSAMAAWALVVETFVNGVVPGTFNPANSFTGTNPTNPGFTGNLGAAVASATKVKAK